MIGRDFVLQPHFIEGPAQPAHDPIGFPLRGGGVIAPVVGVARHVQTARPHEAHPVGLIDKGPERIGQEGVIRRPVQKVRKVETAAARFPLAINVLRLPEGFRPGIKGVVAVHVDRVPLVLGQHVGRFRGDIALAGAELIEVVRDQAVLIRGHGAAFVDEPAAPGSAEGARTIEGAIVASEALQTVAGAIAVEIRLRAQGNGRTEIAEGHHPIGRGDIKGASREERLGGRRSGAFNNGELVGRELRRVSEGARIFRSEVLRRGGHAKANGEEPRIIKVVVTREIRRCVGADIAGLEAERRIRVVVPHPVFLKEAAIALL